MAEYQLLLDGAVLHVPSGWGFPPDPLNAHRIEYELWLADGNVADPYVEPQIPSATDSK